MAAVNCHARPVVNVRGSQKREGDEIFPIELQPAPSPAPVDVDREPLRQLASLLHRTLVLFLVHARVHGAAAGNQVADVELALIVADVGQRFCFALLGFSAPLGFLALRNGNRLRGLVNGLGHLLPLVGPHGPLLGGGFCRRSCPSGLRRHVCLGPSRALCPARSRNIVRCLLVKGTLLVLGRGVQHGIPPLGWRSWCLLATRFLRLVVRASLLFALCPWLGGVRLVALLARLALLCGLLAPFLGLLVRVGGPQAELIEASENLPRKLKLT